MHILASNNENTILAQNHMYAKLSYLSNTSAATSKITLFKTKRQSAIPNVIVKKQSVRLVGVF
jgi:hypothetical protein